MRARKITRSRKGVTASQVFRLITSLLSIVCSCICEKHPCRLYLFLFLGALASDNNSIPATATLPLTVLYTEALKVLEITTGIMFHY